MGQSDGDSVLNTVAYRFNRRLEKSFPEQRLFLRSEQGTRFVILTPTVQLVAWVVSAAFVAWAIIATAVLLMDSVSSGSVREQSQREQRLYEERLRTLADQRDARAAEAVAAQERFNLALAQISEMQSELLASEEHRRELETGINVIQSTLRRTMNERDDARGSLEAMLAEARGEDGSGQAPVMVSGEDMSQTVAVLTAALEATATERDAALAEAAEAKTATDDLIYEARLRDERNNQIFSQLEEAVTVSLEPLDKMFSAAGMSTDNILAQVRRGYSGQGGPLMPMILSTKGEEPNEDMERANQILNELDRMNMYRIAAEKLPFYMPVRPGTFRYTSGFGTRWGRLHAGTDMAGPVGTPIYATADGVVTHADWQSGYGRLIKVQHEFGLETRYAHLSRIRVKKGQRVSRGDLIGDMGNSGRSTGPHLHYEVRVGGKAVNPMTYIKAGRDVF
ncbi:MAG: peptidoglycan DD-metalloendopeptidase family protein [Maritimibacter sp.]|uniref:M23 family metallopeptidase n=1 Tax=Maritimibacter sp. TaxID=2003363 RepID=UPI001D471B2C|nr:M23 family metallopeptidase [Maritimibacter sp.]MBL6429637.1 peptidoglycan DD-metalloendopeptidase family protein [Maritimibacter sp.]